MSETSGIPEVPQVIPLPQVIMLSGYIGVGKTTFRRALEMVYNASKFGTTVSLGTDQIRTALNLHTTGFTQQSDEMRTRPYFLMEQTLRAFTPSFPDQPYILDGTFTHKRCVHFASVLTELGITNYRVLFITVEDRKLHLSRVSSRRLHQFQRTYAHLPRIDYSTAGLTQLNDQMNYFDLPRATNLGEPPLPITIIDNERSEADGKILDPNIRENLELQHALYLLSRHFVEAQEYRDRGFIN